MNSQDYPTHRLETETGSRRSHLRTPSLSSTISTASSSPSSFNDNDNDNESISITFDNGDNNYNRNNSNADNAQDFPQTPLTARPNLTRTTSLPQTPTSSRPGAVFPRFDKLFTTASHAHLDIDTGREEKGGMMHRRTVSSITLGQGKGIDGGRRTYKFGGKVFVPLRMGGWVEEQREETSIKVVTGDDIKVEQRGSSPSSFETEVIDKMNSFRFPTQAGPARSPNRKPLSLNGNRADRARANSPYPKDNLTKASAQQQTSGASRFNPAIIYKRSRSSASASASALSLQTQQRAEMVQPQPLPPSLQSHLHAPERKIILVGPAICQHLQNGGSVRVKDFTGAIVGWMH